MFTVSCHDIWCQFVTISEAITGDDFDNDKD